jgi:hypothetical protein
VTAAAFVAAAERWLDAMKAGDRAMASVWGAELDQLVDSAPDLTSDEVAA